MPKGCFPKPKGKDSCFFIHGAAIRDSRNRREPIYIAWVNMRQRCNNPKKLDYKFYGGRGIRFCKRWEDYKNFLEDMGDTYYEHKRLHNTTSLDRIDVNKNYSKENCRWATRREQSNNRNYNVFYTFNGITKTLGQWREVLPFKITTQNLHKRLKERGWDIERAFTQPPGKIIRFKRLK